MNDGSPSDSSQSQTKRHSTYRARRSQLINAIFNSNSAFNGDQIYALLDELRELHDSSLANDLAKCEALVKEWKDTWYPDFP